MSEQVNSLNYTTVNFPTSGTTDRGTKIVPKNQNGGAMDKNAFLKILAAQLSHLDPSQNQDSSAYVSQMAQFASMEQMQNDFVSGTLGSDEAKKNRSKCYKKNWNRTGQTEINKEKKSGKWNIQQKNQKTSFR